MKRILLLLLIAAGVQAKSQVYNNEWIDYSKTYYKFKVGANKLYRIAQPTLQSLGLDNVPAEHFQLWRNGVEIPLYTSVSSGPLGGSDFIEFWGEMNDGKADKPLYRTPNDHISDKWSLETDTAAYFLTVNPVGNNLRLEQTANVVVGNTIPAEPFFIHTQGNYYKNKIHTGKSEQVGDSYTYSSTYEYGEGWTSVDISTNASLSFTFTNLRPYTGAGAPQPFVRIHAAGNDQNPRYFRVRVNNDSIGAPVMNFYDIARAEIPVAVSQISNTQTTIQITNRCPFPNDRMVVAQTEVVYPRIFNFGGQTSFPFELPANAAGNFLQIANFAHGNVQPVLYDLTNGKRYLGDISNPTFVRVVLQPSAVPRKLVLMSQLGTVAGAITSMEQRNFIDYSLPQNQGDYIIITHPTLAMANNGVDPVDEYRAYRSSPEGGGYTAKVHIIGDLVDQFGYGIKFHPLSIRNFLRWARSKYDSPLKFVLLIGKGVAYSQFRNSESHASIDKLAFVPSFGHPASDNMLSAVPGSSVPLTPIGRISAINGNEVLNYLNKVKEYEQAATISSPAVADKAWMKNVVHVTGAGDQEQQSTLQNALIGHEHIIEDTLFGANVSMFTKTSASSVEQLNSQRLTQLFNEGIGILTYFGHSSASTLEFNLDNPENYDNTGKYPMFVVMGCNAGNFFNFNTLRLLTTETLSEKYILTPNKGSIAFLASSHLGIVHYLDIYNTRFYRALSTTHYGSPLGEVIIETIKKVFQTYSENDFYARFQCEQFTLHGDPALRIYNFPLPDYVIEEPMVKVTPTFISTAEDQFFVNARFMNLGRAIDDTIVIEVKRTYPNLETEVIRRDTIPGILYADSLTYAIDILPTRDKGLNRITITVDADSEVDELYETNNTIVKDITIYDEEARPIYPYNYSIVNTQDIKLTVSTANPFDRVRDYIMELDTTTLFNSPLKVTRTMSSSGGTFDFTPGIMFTDSTVYYWRVAPVVTTGDVNWNLSSFIYLPNSEPGFNQSHFFQHTKSELNRMKLDTASRLWEYGPIVTNLFLRLGTWITSGATQEASLSVAVNGESEIRNTNFFSSLVFNVFHPVTFKAWENEVITPHNFPVHLGEGLYGSTSPQYQQMRKYNFEFRYTDPVSRKRMMNFMKDSVPDGYYIVIRNFTLDTTAFPTFPKAWANDWKSDEALYGPGQSLYHYLKNAGLTTVDSFYKVRPFALVYKKNDPEFAPRQVMGIDQFDNPTMSIDVLSVDTLGFIKSPKFGPAREWKELKWRGTEAPDTEPGDSPTVDVIGVDNAGNESLLYNGLDVSQQDFSLLGVNAADYPYLRLRMRNVDSIHYTPYQMRYWRLTYDPVPEGAIAPNLFFQTKDTLEVGEPFDFKIAFKNVSRVDFDSLKIKLVITNKDNVPIIVPMSKSRPLLANPDTIHIQTNIKTESLAGRNTMYVEVNPDFDQPEQHHFNNYAYRDFYVKPDSLNPLMDVTFDGVHILNRDLVSSKPDIIVKLKDEAKWLVLDDTTLLTLHVRFPNGDTRRFYFNNDTLKFLPAGQAPNPDNTATMEFRPYFAEDGEYELIVTGKDKSENSAGRIEYRVLFQVINKPMISNMLNYPNPFTTSTAFVFTVTGSEVPQNIRIQILTITGKIVREITKEELGPIHIGRNITEFKWDGTDQYGQKLANGIYLYRVITNLNGKSLDKYRAEGDNTDKYFNKGYGKMYLMR